MSDEVANQVDENALPANAEVFDFDAFRAARSEGQAPKAPKVLRIGGKTYTLPGDLPASIMVAYDDIASKTEEEQIEVFSGLVRGLFGKDYAAILGLTTMGELPELMNGMVENLYYSEPGKSQGSAPSSADTTEASTQTSSAITPLI